MFDTVNSLIRDLENPDESVVNKSAKKLSRKKSALPSLIRVLRNSQSSLARYYAAYALCKFGPSAKDAVPALIKQLGNVDTGERLMAMNALRGIGSASKVAIPELVKAGKDSDPLIAQEALETSLHIDESETLRQFIATLT